MAPLTDQSRVTSHQSLPVIPAVSLVLMCVYGFTLAPDVTLWDAGEFQAAVGSLGIPHPPGTPLYILAGNVWVKLLWFLPQAVALNLMSAVATAVACGLLGGLMAKWTSSRLAGIAAGLSAGTMLAVWQNATEAEVYALSFLLGVLMVVAGERAGTTDRPRDRVLLAYLMGLAIPIQISALVLAPAAIFLASARHGAFRWRVAIALGSVLVLVIAVSQGSVVLGGIAIAVGLATAFGRDLSRRVRLSPAALAGGVLLGLSATAFMLVRAPHDPLINQGNPETFDAMMDVVTRQQYPLPGMWPRRAPPWIQLVNLAQYADWQVASGVDDSVAASIWRTPFSLGALFLMVLGARAHWSAERRSARGTALLILGGTLGVVAVLNLSAGPSIQDTVLPPGARHEPRERDYFFAWGFAGAGLWIGLGAVVAARRWLSRAPTRVAPVALGLALLPVALNWQAADRRPDRHVAPLLGDAILQSVPPRAVVFMAGDNDSYTVWYRQAVLAERRDVVPITISLLGAEWYRAELLRRHRLIDSVSATVWRGEQETLRAIVAAAAREGRPVAASISVSPDVRLALAGSWRFTGLAYVADLDSPGPSLTIDTARARQVADLVEPFSANPGGRDPAIGYTWRLLRCPSSILQLGTSNPPDDSALDSRCNFK
ncbi:MAG TPA: DUF2723 domain-containing protein [Gemmatimonadaceae bacterium]